MGGRFQIGFFETHPGHEGLRPSDSPLRAVVRTARPKKEDGLYFVVDGVFAGTAVRGSRVLDLFRSDRKNGKFFFLI